MKQLLKLYRTDGTNAFNLYDQADKISVRELLELDVDILSPCARHHSITEQNVHKVKAKIISAGANVPATIDAEHSLFGQGQSCLPDFVTNCGGVLSAAMSSMGLSERFIARFIESTISPRITNLIAVAERKGTPPRTVAEGIARQRFLLIKQQAERRTMRNTLVRIGGALKARGLLPLGMLKLYAARHFNKVSGDY